MSRRKIGGGHGSGKDFLLTEVTPEALPQSPSRPLSSKNSKKSLRTGDPPAPAPGGTVAAAVPSSATQDSLPNLMTSNSNTTSSSLPKERRGKDARLLLTKAQSLNQQINQDEKITRQFLRDISSAYDRGHSSSIKQQLIQYYFTNKYDQQILNDFYRQLLLQQHKNSTVLSLGDTQQQHVTIESLLERYQRYDEEEYSEIQQLILLLIQISNNYREMVMNISIQLLDSCGIPVTHDDVNDGIATYPTLCSPNLKIMISCFRSFLKMNQTLQSVEISLEEKKTDNFVTNLKQQKALAEQELITVKNELQALKVHYLDPLHPPELPPPLSHFSTPTLFVDAT